MHSGKCPDSTHHLLQPHPLIFGTQKYVTLSILSFFLYERNILIFLNKVVISIQCSLMLLIRKRIDVFQRCSFVPYCRIVLHKLCMFGVIVHLHMKNNGPTLWVFMCVSYAYETMYMSCGNMQLLHRQTSKTKTSYSVGLH